MVLGLARSQGWEFDGSQLLLKTEDRSVQKPS